MTLDEVWQVAKNWILTDGVKLLVGVIILLIVFKIINSFSGSLRKRMEKNNVDATLTKVVHSVLRVGLKIVIFVLFLGYIGVDTAGIGGVIASIGVAIGLALQGSLSNLAGGILIILLRPFKLGDYIEGQGEGGTVENISIFYTYLVTPDNKTVMIPNGSLLNGNITNYSKKSIRRVDLEYSVSYNEDFEKAKAVIKDICLKNQMILKSPEPFIRVKTHGDSSIDIVTRVWVNSGDYWSVYFQMQEDVIKRFEEENIEVPYPQLDVHVDNIVNK